MASETPVMDANRSGVNHCEASLSIPTHATAPEAPKNEPAQCSNPWPMRPCKDPGAHQAQ